MTFDDTLSVSPLNNNITLGSTYSPAHVSINNTACDYQLSGGGLAGKMTLTNQGTALFSKGMSNSYSGLATISAGTLLINHSNALGSVASGASLALSNGFLNRG